MNIPEIGSYEWLSRNQASYAVLSQSLEQCSFYPGILEKASTKLSLALALSQLTIQLLKGTIEGVYAIDEASFQDNLDVLVDAGALNYAQKVELSEVLFKSKLCYIYTVLGYVVPSTNLEEREEEDSSS